MCFGSTFVRRRHGRKLVGVRFPAAGGVTPLLPLHIRQEAQRAETLYIRASDEHVHPVAAGMLRGLQRVGVAGFKVDAGPVAYMVDFLVLGVVLMNNQLGIADHNMI